MAYIYNDCFYLTRGYLHHLHEYRVCVKMLSNLLTELQAQADNPDCICKKYEVMKDYATLKKQVERIDSAISGLSKEEKFLITNFYVKKWTYVKLSLKLHYSERTCRRRVQEITQKVAENLYGQQAKEKLYFISSSHKIG